jgi:(4S)-4-hydroxy-5-phosphonooxypentane-2,3-dione isomerase
VTSTARRDLPPSPYVAIFTIDVKPDRREDFLAAMDKAMAESSREPGVISFSILVDRENSNRFTAVDVYADEAAYLAHLDAPQTHRLIDALDGVLVGPPRGAFHHKICDQSDFSR